MVQRRRNVSRPLGQLAYMVMFLPLGPLMIIGVFFLAASGLLGLGGAVGGKSVGKALRRREYG